MADAASAPNHWDFFGSRQLILALEEMTNLRRLMSAEGDPRSLAMSRLIVDLDAEMTLLGVRTAELADRNIKARIRTTQKRPDTTHKLHMVDAVKSEGLPLGGVVVAKTDELDKVVNQESSSSKPYWLTQELGSVETGNAMTGRILFGRFQGPGHDERPMAEYRGGGGPGSEFLFGGTGAGYGTISHEIEGRHFLRDGSNEAWAYYVKEVQRISERYAAELTALLAVP